MHSELGRFLLDKKIWWVTGLMMMAVIAALVLTQRRQEPLFVGAIIPLSGSAQVYGEDVRDGMILAVEEINAAGGVNGRRLELLVRDSGSDARRAEAHFRELEEEYHPVCYVSVLSSVSMVLAPLAEEHAVVLMALAASAPGITQEREWVFRYWPVAEAETTVLLSIVEELRIDTLGVLHLDDEWGRSMFGQIRESFVRAGGSVVGQSFHMGTSDFEGQLQCLLDPQAVVLVGFEGHLRDGLRQLRQAGFEGSILGANPIFSASIRDMPEAEGTYGTIPIIYNPGFLLASTAREAYETRFNRRFTHYSANGYDALKVLTGLLKDREAGRNELRRSLEQGFIYSGIFGTINVAPGEHDLDLPMHAARIVDGDIHYLWWK